jgi:hypothetical protein
VRDSTEFRVQSLGQVGVCHQIMKFGAVPLNCLATSGSQIVQEPQYSMIVIRQHDIGGSLAGTRAKTT